MSNTPPVNTSLASGSASPRKGIDIIAKINEGKRIHTNADSIKKKVNVDTVRSEYKASVLQKMRDYIDDEDQLVQFVGLPTTVVGRDGKVFHGAYVVKRSMPAHKLMKNRDLCAGVSLYQITEILDDTVKHSSVSKVSEYIKNRLDTFCKGNSIFADYSVEYFDYESHKKRHDPTGTVKSCQFAVLGSRNSSVGVYMIMDSEVGSLDWVIVVRTYDEPSSSQLFDYVNSSPPPTIDNVYKSGLYSTAMFESDATRNRLALELAKGLNFKIHTTPSFTNHYNYAKDHLHTNSEHYLAYYDGCYALNEDSTSSNSSSKRGGCKILYGLGRQNGYKLIAVDPKALTIYANTLYAFPMGLPKITNRYELSKSISDSNNIETLDISSLLRPNQKRLYWGGLFDHHYKALRNVYDQLTTLEEKSLWRSTLDSLGPIGDPHTKSHYLIAVAVYISCAPVDDLTLREAMVFSKHDSPSIRIPRDNAYAMNHLFSDFMAYTESIRKDPNNTTPLPTLRDLVISEEDRFFVLDRRIVQHLIKVSKYNY